MSHNFDLGHPAVCINCNKAVCCVVDICKCENQKLNGEEIIFMKNIIKFKLEPGAISPSVGSEDAACFDLYALEDTHFCPGEIKIVRTGVRMEPQQNLRANIYVRSSTPKNKGFILANSVGIIDTDYRGELGIQLMNVKTFKRFEQLEQDGPFVETAVFVSNSIKKGDKIAQLEIVQNCPARNYEVQYVTELSETKRGEGGFGSTGN